MARSFNGTDQALVASSVDLSGVATASLSWWQWVDAYPADSVEIIFEFSPDINGVTTGFHIYDYNADINGKIASVLGDVGTNSRDYQGPSTSTWHHFVLLLNKGDTAVNEIKLYIDGSLADSGDTPTTNNTNNFAVDELNFMSRNGASLWRDGRLAEVGVWNTIISEANITSLAGTLGVANSAALPSSIAPSNLKGYWALLGTSDPEPDTSGAGHNAVLVGTPTQVAHPIEPAYATPGFKVILTQP